jgi:hypothetical protein
VNVKITVRVFAQMSRNKPKTPPGRMTLKWILVSGKPVTLLINDYSVRKSSAMMANRLASVFKYFYPLFPAFTKSLPC